MEESIGVVKLFPTQFTPYGWLRCDGRMLPISEFQALFSILYNEYGGDGRTTFALPKLPSIKCEGGGELQYMMCVEGFYPRRD